MTGTAEQKQPYRVAVIRALPGLGDFLCAVPALRALRSAMPGARIDLIGLAASRPLTHRFRTYVDRLVEFPGYPGIPEVPSDSRRLLAFLASVRQSPYDLVIQMHGDGTYMNDFALALGTPLVYGFHPAGSAPPSAGRFLRYSPGEPEVRRTLRLVEHLGAPACGEHLEFPLTAVDAAELSMVAEVADLQPGGYAVIHPGASSDEKRSHPELFARAADRLALAGLTPVLTGVVGEAHLSAAVMREMGMPAIDLTGRTSLGALAMLVSRAALVVANDTGVSHLADALAVPSIIVFSASDPRRWAPLDTTRHRVVDLTASTNGSYHWALAEVLARAAGWDVVELEPVTTDLPLSGVLAEVEYLLALGGGSVS